jgi:hypothetical protein
MPISKLKSLRVSVMTATLVGTISVLAPLAPGSAIAQDWLSVNAAGRSCVVAYSDNTTQTVPCSGTLTLPPCSPRPTRAPVSLLMTDEFGIQHTKSLMRPAGITDQVNQTPGSPGACLPVAPPPPPSASLCQLNTPMPALSTIGTVPQQCSFPPGNYRHFATAESQTLVRGVLTPLTQNPYGGAGDFTVYQGETIWFIPFNTSVSEPPFTVRRSSGVEMKAFPAGVTLPSRCAQLGITNFFCLLDIDAVRIRNLGTVIADYWEAVFYGNTYEDLLYPDSFQSSRWGGGVITRRP